MEVELLYSHRSEACLKYSELSKFVKQDATLLTYSLSENLFSNGLETTSGLYSPSRLSTRRATPQNMSKMPTPIP